MLLLVKAAYDGYIIGFYDLMFLPPRPLLGNVAYIRQCLFCFVGEGECGIKKENKSLERERRKRVGSERCGWESGKREKEWRHGVERLREVLSHRFECDTGLVKLSAIFICNIPGCGRKGNK